MEKTQRLQNNGVAIAQDKGDAFQKTVVLLVMLISIGLLLVNGMSNPVLVNMLPLVAISIDSLSGCCLHAPYVTG